MTAFRVWAPEARAVAVEVGGARVPMAADAKGWWSADVPSASAGTLYRYVVDGSEPLPDPRSASQPEGVHGPSAVVDHASFPWSEERRRPRPLADAVIYELHVGTFTPGATFESAIERLDHLVDLGVTHVELMPVQEFAGERGWGYDGVDLYAPHHSYGGPVGLKRLVDACHRRGLAALLDVVYNHLGPAGNHLSRFGPYFTDRYATPWGPAVNLDGPESDEVRRFLCDNALQWLRDYRFDGLRVDAVHAIHDASAIHFLEQLATEVERLAEELGRPLVVIAESDLNDPRVVRSQESGGYGFDAQWSDDFHHALHAVLTGEQDGYYADFGSLADLAKSLTSAFVYDGRYSPHRRRHHGRPPTGLPGSRFVGFLQNHDQVGNRARGERTSHLLSHRALKVGAALVLTAPFVPLLFQGEEWGASAPFLYFCDFDDPALARAVREGRRREFAAFGWRPEDVPDPLDPATYLRAKLDWSELGREPHAELLDWYRALIRLRSGRPELRDGRLPVDAVRYDERERWLTFARGRIVVACSFADRTSAIPCEVGRDARVLLASDAGVERRGEALHLPAESVAILEW
jgi:maltooligosyltrehalose trehalohydrolase